MGEISDLLKGLSVAATNSYAFVSYIIAIIAWTYLRSRVDRNKNLLKRITALPEDDRIKILEQEMGTVGIEGGLSPEQWIRSKIHQYYFFGFVVLCAVVVIIVAIFLNHKNKESQPQVIVVPPPTIKFPPPPDPNIALETSMSEIDLGVQRDFVIAKLGQPRHSYSVAGLQCADYNFAFAKAQFWYSASKDLLLMYVVPTSSDYHPNVISRYRDALYDPPGFKGCLGCFSFRDLTIDKNSPAPTAEDPFPNKTLKPEYEGDPDIVQFNSGGSAAPFVYVEKFDVAASWRRYILLVNTSEGDSDDSSAQLIPPLVQFMNSWNSSDKSFTEFFETLLPEQKQQFDQLRGAFHPNAFAVVSTDVDDLDSSKVPIANGQIESVSCTGDN